mgnify:CR=1 FL=1
MNRVAPGVAQDVRTADELDQRRDREPRPQQILPPGMPGYQEYKLYPGPDMNKAKQLIAEANPEADPRRLWVGQEIKLPPRPGQLR